MKYYPHNGSWHLKYLLDLTFKKLPRKKIGWEAVLKIVLLTRRLTNYQVLFINFFQPLFVSLASLNLLDTNWTDDQFNRKYADWVAVRPTKTVDNSFDVTGLND